MADKVGTCEEISLRKVGSPIKDELYEALKLNKKWREQISDIIDEMDHCYMNVHKSAHLEGNILTMQDILNNLDADHYMLATKANITG